MEYQLKKYNGQKSFFYTKNELFNIIDDLGKKAFCEEFVFSKKHGYYVVSKFIETKYNKYTDSYFNETVCVFVNGLFVIKDRFGYTVDYKQLFQEYNQSRNIKNRNYTDIYRKNDRSTARYRRKKFRKNNDRKSSRKKEYIQLLNSEYDFDFLYKFDSPIIKSRKKRLQLVKSFCTYYYDDYPKLYVTNRSWKKQHKKKQWL